MTVAGIVIASMLFCGGVALLKFSDIVAWSHGQRLCARCGGTGKDEGSSEWTREPIQVGRIISIKEVSRMGTCRTCNGLGYTRISDASRGGRES
jgi:hypothetical protein